MSGTDMQSRRQRRRKETAGVALRGDMRACIWQTGSDPLSPGIKGFAGARG
jgi:hypothetical protein